MNNDASEQVRGFDKCLWVLDETPLDMIHRAALGAILLPAYETAFGRGPGLGRFVAFFFAVLLVFKFGMGFVRRLFPASAALKAAWRERRMLGKAYDSYQWRKQFGYGLGLLAFLLFSGREVGAFHIFAGGCIVAGIIGIVIWRQRRASLVPATPAPASA